MTFVVAGQACSDECGKDRCNLSASDCIDGICQTAVGNTCAALGEKRPELRRRQIVG